MLSPNSTTAPEQKNQITLIGYSHKINDPAFAGYQKKSILWSFIFSLILAVIACIAFPIYGDKSGEIPWPNSLYYGLGLGGMFVTIALLQTLKKKLDKTWDGTVEYKDSYRQKRARFNGRANYDSVYIINIRKDNGGIKKHKFRNIPGPYHYYNVGDKVRHHKGFYYYEKYDKSKDDKIMCAACLSYHDIHLSSCPRCKCPLLN